MTAIAAVEDPRQCWQTPGPLFRALHRRYRFDVDAAASDDNQLLPIYWTVRDDGVAQLSDPANDHLFAYVNPPYGNIAPWVDACIRRAQRSLARAVMLLPARVDQRWFHAALAAGAEVVYIKGRVQFDAPPGVVPSSNREPSILLVFGCSQQRVISARGEWL